MMNKGYSQRSIAKESPESNETDDTPLKIDLTSSNLNNYQEDQESAADA
jgi:hypothetical protein